MSEQTEPEIRSNLQPQTKDVAYDLDRALAAVVSVRARIAEDAFTASILGTERAGHGVLVGDGSLVVTIGYLIAEAQEIWLVDQHGNAVAGHVVGYDYETGFGLVQLLGALALPAMEMGTSAALLEGDDVVVAGFGGREKSVKAQIITKREFAGYWEYVLDEAIFTAPPHPNWGGTGLISPDGQLAGIGSLYVQQIPQLRDAADGNMIVPIDILKPIMEDLLTYGRRLGPARPWLGMFVTEAGDKLVVAGAFKDAPAEKADVRIGDMVLGVGGEPVDELAGLFRKIWSMGDAGVDIPLTLYRDGNTFEVQVQSGDRNAHFKAPSLH